MCLCVAAKWGDEFEDDVAKMVQYRLITDEYADFYLNLKSKK